MLEKEIERRVCRYAKSLGFLDYKFSSPAHAGVPDRMFIAPHRRLFFIEFKAPGKRPTAIQEREHTKLRNAGFNVWVIDDVASGEAVIRIELGS
jgi:hypothetical protein